MNRGAAALWFEAAARLLLEEESTQQPEVSGEDRDAATAEKPDPAD